uniref:Uncharacterized protein n=1 Tax=Triticum urartu TaxID=4572 RepID=A0A8R7QRZ4_TRIUA
MLLEVQLFLDKHTADVPVLVRVSPLRLLLVPSATLPATFLHCPSGWSDTAASSGPTPSSEAVQCPSASFPVIVRDALLEIFPLHLPTVNIFMPCVRTAILF